jgi:DNA-binding protein YbaB
LTPEQLASIRATGEAAGGLVRAEVDGGGQLSDLALDPRAMRLPAAELAEALKSALQEAQAAFQLQLAETAGQLGGRLPSRSQLTGELDEMSASAERRMNEICTALYDLSRRAGSQW